MNVVECPYCNVSIVITKLNCSIFRCGILKKNNKQINPHLSKTDCDDLAEKNLIYGCAKPFKVILDNDKYTAIKCDYL
jgi:hypothetical protein